MRVGKEIIWKLKGQAPDKIPMARLAEYMEQLAIILGEQADVRFLRVEKSSLNVVAKMVGGGTATRVARRVDAIRRGSAPSDAMRAYGRVNEMVFEDGGPARLVGPATVLYFPGTRPDPSANLKVLDYGDVSGRLYALAEQKSGDVSARIRPSGGGPFIPCTASENTGRRLRDFLFEAVRVYGRGTWARDDAGAWQCEKLHIEEVKPVQQASLREAIEELRLVEAEWPDDPLRELDEISEMNLQA